MIPDTLVGDLLLEALLLDEPGLQDDLGFVVDGFPRTACQVGVFITTTAGEARSFVMDGWLPALCLPRALVTKVVWSRQAPVTKPRVCRTAGWCLPMGLCRGEVRSAVYCLVFWCGAAGRSIS